MFGHSTESPGDCLTLQYAPSPKKVPAQLTMIKVALALFLVGGLSLVRLVVVVIAQFLGGIAAAAVVSALLPGPMTVATTLGGGANIAQGLFIEMFLTAQLVFVIIMLAAEKHKSTFLAPIGIGITFFLAELVG